MEGNHSACWDVCVCSVEFVSLGGLELGPSQTERTQLPHCCSQHIGTLKVG